MARYAKNTSVAVAKSKAEIEKTLQRYGASEFAYGCTAQKAMIGFCFNGKTIRLTLILPLKSTFYESPTGRERCDSSIEKLWEQACRQRWRALALVIKAKLEAVESGIATLEDEFLAYMALPDGSTVGQVMAGQLDKLLESGKLPALMPG